MPVTVTRRHKQEQNAKRSRLWLWAEGSQVWNYLIGSKFQAHNDGITMLFCSSSWVGSFSLSSSSPPFDSFHLKFGKFFRKISNLDAIKDENESSNSSNTRSPTTSMQQANNRKMRKRSSLTIRFGEMQMSWKIRKKNTRIVWKQWIWI